MAAKDKNRDNKTQSKPQQAKDEKAAMPITDVTKRADISKLLNPGREKRQTLQGFDDDYVDIVDYIVRCTHKIWEGRGMGLIYTHYTHNAQIHTSDGLVYGREAWLNAAIAGLSAFPDRRVFTDDVIWAGNDQDGFYTSHRVTSIGTNTGYSPYGPPTGRKVIYQVISDCIVKENRIAEEWVVRDGLSVIRQLGLPEKEVVAQLAEQAHPDGTLPESFGEIERLQGQDAPVVYQPQESGQFDIEDFIRQCLHEVWNWRLFNKIHDYYRETYRCHTSTSREIYGWGDYLAYLMEWLMAFPDGQLLIDHLCWLGDDQAGYRVACRWSFSGTHRGYGKYGPPTGKRVRVMGLSHFWVKDGRFSEEWTVFDELSLLKQLYVPPDVADETVDL